MGLPRGEWQGWSYSSIVVLVHFSPYPFFHHTLFFAIPFFSPYPFSRHTLFSPVGGSWDHGPPPDPRPPLILCPACPPGSGPGSGEAVPASAATDGRAGGGIEVVGGGRMGRSRARGRILTKSP